MRWSPAMSAELAERIHPDSRDTRNQLNLFDEPWDTERATLLPDAHPVLEKAAGEEAKVGEGRYSPLASAA